MQDEDSNTSLKNKDSKPFKSVVIEIERYKKQSIDDKEEEAKQL